MKKSKRQEIELHNYEYWLKTKTQGQRKTKRVAAILSTKAAALLALQSGLGVTL